MIVIHIRQDNTNLVVSRSLAAEVSDCFLRVWPETLQYTAVAVAVAVDMAIAVDTAVADRAVAVDRVVAVGRDGRVLDAGKCRYPASLPPLDSPSLFR